MSSLPQGYDAWKTAIHDEVYCPECSRGVGFLGRRKEDHSIQCSQHPNAGQFYSLAACRAVRALLKDVLPDGFRLDYVRDDQPAPEVYEGNEQTGRRVTVEIFVTNHEIREAL